MLMIYTRRIRWTGHVTCTEEKNSYRVLVSKPVGKRPLGRPGDRWKDKTSTGRLSGRKQ
jgi:hypothetical protein